MKKRTRFIILITCFLLFFIITPCIVGYALGYRIDFESRKIVATGGIYVKAIPQPLEVYIDSKLTGKTNVFSNAAFTQNLLPKTHTVLVKKDGYYDYRKTVLVKEKEVSKLENIVLFKKNLSFQIIKNDESSPFNQKEETEDKTFYLKNKNLYINFENPTLFYSPANNFEISPDGQKVLFCNDYEILYSYFNAKEPEIVFLNRFSEKISNCLWLNNDYIIFTLAGKIKISEINRENEINIVDIPSTITLESGKTLEITSPKIIFNQQDKKLYILTGKTLLVSEPLLP